MNHEQLQLHIVTVASEEFAAARAKTLTDFVNPLSARIVAELSDLGEWSHEAPTLVRLTGPAHTGVMTWMGPGGRVSTDAAVLGFADGIVATVNEPPRAVTNIANAFVSAVASSKLSYDPKGAALIIGAEDETKAIAVSLSRLGFKRISIVDPSDHKSEQMVNALKKRLLGIEFVAIPRATLTQVPNEASMAINTLKNSKEPLLGDVSYLNFLQKAGVWIDWSGVTTELGFEEEVANAEAQLFSADLVRAWRELLLIENFPGVRLAETRESWVHALEQAWTSLRLARLQTPNAAVGPS